MADRPIFTDDGTKLRLLDAVGRLTREGARAEASILSTYSVNFAFYEDVVLRMFERAGCRLNILMVDAGQAAVALADPLRRPRRAGKDYILAPISAPGAFHPKILALLSDKRPMLAVGSHNATEAGFARNLEATVCWGHDGAGVPPEAMSGAIEFLIGWLASSPGFDAGFASEVAERVRHLCPRGGTRDQDATFLGWHRGGPSLLEQFRGLVRGDVKTALALGPFFDGGLRLIHELKNFGAKEVVVGVQPNTVSLTRTDLARFVDASILPGLANAACSSKDKRSSAPYLHAKALAIETDQGRWLALGSANPSAPAWMQGENGNAEAVVVLSGAAADAAFERLGLGPLTTAPELTAQELQEMAERSRQEIQASDSDDAASPIQMAVVSGGLIPLIGVNAADCRQAIELAEEELLIASAEFHAGAGGTEMSLGKRAHVVRVDGDFGPLATVIIHSLSQYRAATRPRNDSKILERLGRLDDPNEDFGELLALMDRYIFAEPTEALPSASRPGSQAANAAPQPDVPFGPRGVSVMAAIQARHNERRIIEFELSEIISILIRDLTEAKISDGDLRDIDAEDAGGSAPAAVEEVDAPPLPVNWDRLVTACRQRVGTMVNKLRKRLEPPIPDADKAAWLFGRLLTVLSLLLRLRSRLSPPGLDSRRGRPESLVSTDQIRSAFKAGVEALYRKNGGIAAWLEESVDHRVAAERSMLDTLLLWAAREIGADADAHPTFDEAADERLLRLGDKADAIVVAMSAAANADVASSPIGQIAGTDWKDAAHTAPDWWGRHFGLGTAMQSAIAANGWLPTLNRQVRAGDLAVWKKEPGFPRVIVTVPGNKAVFLNPGANSDKDVLPLGLAMVEPVDVTALMAIGQTTQKEASVR